MSTKTLLTTLLKSFKLPSSSPRQLRAAPKPSTQSFAYVPNRRLLAALTAGIASTLVIYQYQDEPVNLLSWVTTRSIQLDSSDKASNPTVNRPATDGFRIDPDTSTPHPLTIPLDNTTNSGRTLTLVGLGVRKVSFLRVKVYSAGFYVEDYILKRLHDIEGWHTFTAQHLLIPPTGPSPQLTGEALMRTLLDRTACAIRIVPVRNTDFSHLRDGFIRAISARQKLARSRGELSPVDDERLARSLQLFKAIFPTGSVPKGKSLTLLHRADSIEVQYEGKVLGAVSDSWLARELFMAYFADKDVISEKLKEDVARGLEQHTRR